MSNIFSKSVLVIVMLSFANLATATCTGEVDGCGKNGVCMDGTCYF